jgi:predicted RNA-binding Zn-ribbon protein involved in translation (DUF1610 family)/uncharacterized membrane protein YgcG
VVRNIVIALLMVLILSGLASAEIGLPKQMGDINDYGGVFGGNRKKLQGIIDDLKGFGVNLVVLISLRDPYNDPALYAAKVMEEWGLDERTVFVVFVREEEGWSFVIKIGSGLELELGKINHLERLVKEGRIREGVEETAGHISAIIKGEYKEQDSGLFAFYGLAVLAVAGIFLAAWRFLRFCPHCGRRMRVRESNPFGERHLIYRCFNCGYSKVKVE